LLSALSQRAAIADLKDKRRKSGRELPIGKRPISVIQSSYRRPEKRSYVFAK